MLVAEGIDRLRKTKKQSTRYTDPSKRHRLSDTSLYERRRYTASQDPSSMLLTCVVDDRDHSPFYSSQDEAYTYVYQERGQEPILMQAAVPKARKSTTVSPTMARGYR